MKGERISPHSSSIMLKSLDFFFKNTPAEVDQAKKIAKDKIAYLGSVMRKPTMKDLRKYLNQNFTPIEADLALKSLQLAGPVGKITFEYSNVDTFLIDATTQNNFKIVPDINILLQQEVCTVIHLLSSRISFRRSANRILLVPDLTAA